MKIYRLFFLFLVLPLFSIAQRSYESAVLKTTDGVEKEVQVKAIDYLDFPEKFIVLIDGSIQSLDLKQVQSLEFKNQPVTFKQIEVIEKGGPSSKMARVLVKSNIAQLYFLVEGDQEKYYVQKNTDQNATYLNNNLAINDSGNFIRILEKDYKTNISMNELSKLGYTKKELTNYISSYNQEQGSSESEVMNFTTFTKPLAIRLKAGLGLNTVDVTATNNLFAPGSFDVNNSFDFQVHLEYHLNKNRDKWAFTGGLGYTTGIEGDYLAPFVGSGNTNFNTQTSFQYEFISGFFGARHYMYVNQDWRVILGAELESRFTTTDSFISGDGPSPFIYRYPNDITFNLNLGVEFTKEIGFELSYNIKNALEYQSGDITRVDMTRIKFLLTYSPFQF